MSIETLLSSAKAAIVTVGDGRGFLVDGSRSGRLVVTAAHCLPHLPPPHPFSHTAETTYRDLVGPLGGKPSVWADCLFVDPIADVAVLCEPDDQVYLKEATAYTRLVEAAAPLRVGILTEPCDAWLQTLDGRWQRCTVRVDSPYGPTRSLMLVGAVDANATGTSGSPIVRTDGRVLGVVSVGTETGDEAGDEQAGQPLLASVLPLWLLSDLRANVVKARASCRQYTGFRSDPYLMG